MTTNKRVGLYEISVPCTPTFYKGSIHSESVWADTVKILKDGRTTLSRGGQIVGVCPGHGVVKFCGWRKRI